ncbi:MAG: sugar ABC transporter ATP-binding protein [Anaerolineae bacterium]|uniref:sugar ABC transporter ATP-binding protein n=1 Tax=Candidatus Amarolinea dominans TaxID=3140696 RepID=UPI001DA5E05A|nr:sugar ABC transporter ATP-binding protein [Anaerolineae bacterium]MBK7202275.1 sugar ABC transporter ATP-binding protein [Anaerolineae bacterium]MBK9094467.1 sugar ABC transporter ATP-binding protein [Anaerolineae bacterium]MBK9233251.1 sugar ABC transporter ATP-binding protein [Anaerolineae bacterium]
MSIPILEMKNITKEFPGVKALSNVSFRVAQGEIHCLVGENGAGKSTLMKVLSGVWPYGSYTGEIFINGQPQRYKHINDSEKAGIAIIYQELALIPELTVYENIFIGHEIRNGFTVDWNETIKRAGEMLKKVKLDVNPAAKVKDLGVGKQQLIEIAKALSRDVKILILDEPTAALNENDSDNLLNLLRGLREQGVTCIMISHKLKEVIAIADSVTVLRDGQTVCSLDAHKGEVSENVLIKHMVGREIDNIYPKRKHVRSEDVVLEVKGWNAYSPALGRNILRDVSFNVKRGEIIGFAGLMGAGRTELALSIFGNPDGYRLSGDLSIKGRKRHIANPRDAINAGIAYVSEDRKGDGLILIQDVKQNITLANLEEIANRGVVDNQAEIKVATEYKTSLNIKTPSIEQKVSNLSGGNQQKVSLGKWLFVKPDVMILDEPTRGIDVGAKYEIYTLMNRLVEQGMSIIMISSELPEVLGMSDRVYVVASGRIAGEMPTEEATQEKIMHLATN